MAFHFGKPTHFQFIAGQALNLTLVTPPQTDAEGDSRTFTIANAPEDDEIVIATRLRDTAFKRVLASMPIGTHVQAEGPDRQSATNVADAVGRGAHEGGCGAREVVRGAHEVEQFAMASKTDHRPARSESATATRDCDEGRETEA